MNKDRECVALGECRPPHHATKDRTRWCGGKVGLEHVWTWVDERRVPNAFHLHRWPGRPDHRMVVRERRICDRCGKQPYSRGRNRCRSHGVLEPGTRCDHMPQGRRIYVKVGDLWRRVRGKLAPLGSWQL